MDLQAWLAVVAVWVVTEVVLSAVLKKAPLWVSKQSIAAYHHLMKEIALLRRVIDNARFAKWSPKTIEYSALRTIKVKSTSQPISQSALDLLESHLKRGEPVVLLGKPGAGKTTVMEALTYRLARRALRHARWLLIGLILVAVLLLFVAPILSLVWLATFFLWEPLVRRTIVPLFLDARKYRGNVVNDWILKTLEKELGEKPLFGWRNRLAFLVDGVNEVQTNLYEAFGDDWRSILQQKRRHRVIFASRTAQGDQGGLTQRLGLNDALTICSLDDVGVEELLKVYGRRKSADEGIPFEVERVKREFDDLQNKGLLCDKGIGRNPFWLENLVMSGLRTHNRGKLFRDSAQKLIHRETEARPRNRERHLLWEKIVPSEVEMDALGNLALAMHGEKRVGFVGQTEWDKASIAINESISDLRYSIYDILYEAESATLVRFKRKEFVEFVHPLVQDFFAAYALRMRDKWATAEDHFGDRWWWQTILMFSGIVEDHPAFVQQVLGDGNDSTRVCLSFGLLDGIDKFDWWDTPQIIDALKEASNELDQAVVAEWLSQSRALEQISQKLSRVMGLSPREKWTSLASHFDQFTEIEYSVTLALAGSLAQGVTKTHKDSLRELSRITEEVIVDRLASLLVPEGAWIKKQVIELLEILGGTKGAEYIVLAMGDEVVRDVARSALVQIGTPAVKPLIQALAWDQESWFKENAERRKEAVIELQKGKTAIVQSLEGTENSKVAKGLREQLDHLEMAERLIVQNNHLVQEIEPLLEQVSEPQLIKQIEQHFEKLDLPDELAATFTEYWRTVKLLSQRVPCPQDVIDTLVEIGEPAVEPLVQAMNPQTPFEGPVPGRAARALGKIASRRAIEGLVSKLDDNDWLVDPVKILKEIGEPAIDVLVNMLDSENPITSVQASNILHDIGQPVVVPLIEALRDGRVAVHGMQLLGKIGGRPENLDHLLSALGSGNPYLELGASLALHRVGEPSIDRLITSLDEKRLWVSAVNVLTLAGSSAVEPLTRALNHPSAAVRAGAMNALGQIGHTHGINDRWVVESIIGILRGEEDEHVRGEAVSALAQIGDAAIGSLDELVRDQDLQMRAFAWVSLVNMAALYDIVPAPITEALKDEDPSVRYMAIIYIYGGAVGDFSMIKPLVRRIPHESWEWRRRILISLVRIVSKSVLRPGRRARTAKRIRGIRNTYQDLAQLQK